jgi:hypothetical protein
MRTQNLFAKAFFASSAALLLAAALLLPAAARAQDDFEFGSGVVVGGIDDQFGSTIDDKTGTTVDSDIQALLKRCPGRVQPTCGTAQSGGITLYYYFP